jgi:hypothetical protein
MQAHNDIKHRLLGRIKIPSVAECEFPLSPEDPLPAHDYPASLKLVLAVNFAGFNNHFAVSWYN